MSSESPRGGVKVTGAVVRAAAAEAVAALDLPVEATVAHTALATTVKRIRLTGMRGRPSLAVGF